MPKRKVDQLFRLVKSLSKAEKRHFKLNSRGNLDGKLALFLQLFNVLDRMNVYDEGMILQRIPDLSKKQLPNVKTNLYRHILTSLRLLNRSNITSIGIRELLDYAIILHSKKLYQQSLHILIKAKHRAMVNQLNTLALEIVSFEKYIKTHYLSEDIRNNTIDVDDQALDLSEQVRREQSFSDLSIKLYRLSSKLGYARNAKEKEYAIRYFNAHLPVYFEDDLSFFEKLYLYQAYVWICSITLEFPKQYRYAYKWVNLFHLHPKLIDNNIPAYLKGLHNLLNSLYLTLKIDPVCIAIQIVKRSFIFR